MKIETLVNLIDGELLNSPYISEVVHFTDNVDEVNRGSCFFARKISDIVFAIKNGAYAVIVDRDVDILDEEIAWIRVENFGRAIFNIFKYENLNQKIYKVNKIELEIVRKINNDKRVVVVEDDIFRAINLRDKFLFSSKEFTNSSEIEKKDCEIEDLGLFRIKFENEVVKISPVYKEEFCKIVNFFKENNLKYTLEFEFDRLKPIFIDSLYREVEFGESDRVVIVGIENDEYFFKELNFIVEKTKHAKTLFIDKHHPEFLHKSFNFAVMVGIDFEPNEIEEGELFD